jgi:hypothetical protein
MLGAPGSVGRVKRQGDWGADGSSCGVQQSGTSCATCSGPRRCGSLRNRLTRRSHSPSRHGNAGGRRGRDRKGRHWSYLRGSRTDLRRPVVEAELRLRKLQPAVASFESAAEMPEMRWLDRSWAGRDSLGARAAQKNSPTARARSVLTLSVGAKRLHWPGGHNAHSVPGR